MNVPPFEDLTFDTLVAYRREDDSSDMEHYAYRSEYFVNPYKDVSYCMCKVPFHSMYFIGRKFSLDANYLIETYCTYDSSTEYMHAQLLKRVLSP